MRRATCWPKCCRPSGSRNSRKSANSTWRWPVEGLGNFRISALRQRGTYAAVIRYIPNEIPALASLNVPPLLGELIMEKRGLLLMVGATGAGKSTTLASMIDHRNETVTGHILTIEDPIEFFFTNKKSVVNQREIGTDTQSLQVALKNALRQAPDVILIGEIRDRETMSAAIAYAQSGHLCLATMHANNSYQALNRILSFYPVEVRPTMLGDLAAALEGRRLAAPAAHANRRPRAGGGSHAQHQADFRADRERRLLGRQGSDGKIHGRRLADLRAGHRPPDHRRHRDAQGRPGACRFADQPDVAAGKRLSAAAQAKADETQDRPG